jgi:hypothetical protein
MRRSLAALVVALSAVPSAAGDGAEGGTRLGRVLIDKHEATVTLRGPTAREDRYTVTVQVTRPRGSPAIKASRLQVWLVRKHYTADRPALGVAHFPRGKLLPEREGKEGVVASASFSFHAAGLEWEGLGAVVVAIDDEPVAFKIPRQAK